MRVLGTGFIDRMHQRQQRGDVRCICELNRLPDLDLSDKRAPFFLEIG